MLAFLGSFIYQLTEWEPEERIEGSFFGRLYIKISFPSPFLIPSRSFLFLLFRFSLFVIFSFLRSIPGLIQSFQRAVS